MTEPTSTQWSSALNRMRSLATRVLTEHHNHDSVCTACDQHWPCKPAILAEHNLAIAAATHVPAVPEPHWTKIDMTVRDNDDHESPTTPRSPAAATKRKEQPMTDRSAPSTIAIDVYVCAVIGREDDVLLTKRPAGDWALPTTQVGGGEWVGDELDRGVRETVGIGVDSASFVCMIEDRDGLFLVFDVILQDELALTDAEPAEGPSQFLWTQLDQLDSLQLWPKPLHRALLADSPSWLGHDSPLNRG